MSPARAKLRVVAQEPDERPSELGLYAEVRRASNDGERWRRVHERSQRAPAVNLADRVRRLLSRGGGVRVERGGFKFEERN